MLGSVVGWLFTHLTKINLDTGTFIAIETVLLMMLQMEHERCDRVRAGWREVRRLTFAVTSAIQRAKVKEGQPDAADYHERAQTLAQELYAAILLNGKGSLKKEYRKELNRTLMERRALMPLLEVFGKLDPKLERKFDAWKFRIL